MRHHSYLCRDVNGWRGAGSFLGNSQSTRSAKTQVERILADGPALKLVTEKSSYVPTER